MANDQLTALATFLKGDRARMELQAVSTQPADIPRFIRTALTVIADSPKLQQCDRQSLFRAIRQAAALGLEPGGLFQEASLVPYKSNVQLIPTARGLMELHLRSGRITEITSRVVREGDTFNAFGGTNPRLDHAITDGDGEVTHAYAIATWADGHTSFELMSRSEIEAVRSRSSAGSDGPWNTDFAEMARKTVVKRLSKSLPVKSEDRAVLASVQEHPQEQPEQWQDPGPYLNEALPGPKTTPGSPLARQPPGLIDVQPSGPQEDIGELPF